MILVGIILFSGNYSVKSNKGNWKTFNGRKSVFHGNLMDFPRFGKAGASARV